MLAGSSVHLQALVGVQRQRFFTQDVLASLGGADRPFPVQAVRQRDIDSVNILGLQQGHVAAVRVRNPQAAGEFFGFFEVTAGHRHHFAVSSGLDGGNHCRPADIGCAEHPPADLFLCHICSSSTSL
jgi:hypothetical protein